MILNLSENKGGLSVPIWVRLYSLPTNYWSLTMLKGIGDEIGEYIKLLEGTRDGYYVSYARIYIYLDVSGVLLDTIKLVFKDEV